MPAAGRARGTNHAPTTLRRFPTFRDGSRWLATPSLTDVEDALVAYAKERRPARGARRCGRAEPRLVLLARDLYVHGLGNYLAVIDAQVAQYRSEDLLCNAIKPSWSI